MIHYTHKLVLTDKVNSNLNKYKQEIERKSFISRACIIKFSANPDDVFDIIPVMNLKLLNKYDDMTVIGIAESRKAAINLCAEMTKMYLDDNTDKITMRKYFEDILL